VAVSAAGHDSSGYAGSGGLAPANGQGQKRIGRAESGRAASEKIGKIRPQIGHSDGVRRRSLVVDQEGAFVGKEEIVMPFRSKPLGALSIAVMAAVTTVSPGRAQAPGAEQQTSPQTGTEVKPSEGSPTYGQAPPTSAPTTPAPNTSVPTYQAPSDRTAAAPPRRPARPGSAVVSAKVNLRSGPGTDSEVLTTIPAGSSVRVANCSGEWCTVTWNGQSGYAIARNLNLGASRQARAYPPQPGYPDGYEGAPPVVYGEPGYYGPPAVVYGPAYYYGPRIYYGPGWGWRRHWW
jgi:uncharacterized protein YraI